MSICSDWEGEPPGEPLFIQADDQEVMPSSIENISKRLTRRFALPKSDRAPNSFRAPKIGSRSKFVPPSQNRIALPKPSCPFLNFEGLHKLVFGLPFLDSALKLADMSPHRIFLWEGEPPGEPLFIQADDQEVMPSSIENISKRLTRRFALP
jgi:hypothetical protein